MSDQDTTYNGWKNYPTWAVNLWLSNDEGLYNEVTAQVQEITAEDESRSEYWTLTESHKYTVADTLKEMVEAITEDEEIRGMSADLLGWSVGHVDWNEIATAWLSEVEAA